MVVVPVVFVSVPVLESEGSETGAGTGADCVVSGSVGRGAGGGACNGDGDCDGEEGFFSSSSSSSSLSLFRAGALVVPTVATGSSTLPASAGEEGTLTLPPCGCPLDEADACLSVSSSSLPLSSSLPDDAEVYLNNNPKPSPLLFGGLRLKLVATAGDDEDDDAEEIEARVLDVLEPLKEEFKVACSICF